MRIVIHNSFIGKHAAENELSRRISLAVVNLGWEAIEVVSAAEIKEFNPDFVIVTHFDTPKLSEFPTYGCMWNPPVFMEKYEDWIKELNKELMNAYFIYPEFYFRYKNILSYDAYLFSSSQIKEWISFRLFNKEKKYFFTPFFTSCNQTNYISPNIQEPYLVYMGTNWDGSRFKQLFKQLDTKNFMRVYGSNWNYLKKSYKGILPFDGTSVLTTLNQAGVGLCLHRHEHTESETPSMRIFEIVASGAIAICGEHKFIREAFGDSVLYIDINASIPEQVEQISEHINWIKTHQQEALEMSKKAHDIFSKKYTLEKLLLDIIPHHQNLIKSKGFIEASSVKVPDHQVQLIVRVGDRPLFMLRRCLDSIIKQTYKNVAVILVKGQEIAGLDKLLHEYEQIIDIKIVNSKFTGFKSTQLQDGLNAVTSEYFGIVNDTAIIYPNHVQVLTSLLQKNEFAGIAYSGSIRAWEDSNTLTIIDKDLVYFESFDICKISRFENFITSNSFIARSSLISDVFAEGPKLETGEDFFLILQLCRKAIFLFSYEATCEFYWHNNVMDNVTLSQLNNFEILLTTTKLKNTKVKLISDRLWEMFKDKEFLCVEDFMSDQEVVTKYIPLSELRYCKTEKILEASQIKISVYEQLRKIYLKLSRGGKFNKNPNLISKLLVSLKQLFLE